MLSTVSTIFFTVVVGKTFMNTCQAGDDNDQGSKNGQGHMQVGRYLEIWPYEHTDLRTPISFI